MIDASNSVVMPGLVDANARYGLRGDANEQSLEITPGFCILDAIDPHSLQFQRATRLGVTTAHNRQVSALSCLKASRTSVMCASSRAR